MSDLNEILNLVPTDQVAQALGVDEQSAEAAIRAAVPSLLAGMQSNAGSPEGADALAGALADHSNDLASGSVDLGQVDTADGEKIVNHVLGDRQDLLANQLSGANTAAGLDLGSLVRKALPILAPIVLSYLAKKWSERGGSSSAVPTDSGQAGGQGGGLGDLLGGLLGGVLGGGAATQGGGQGSAQGSGNPLDDLLGGLLGGGPAQSAPDQQQVPQSVPQQADPQQAPQQADPNAGNFGGGVDNSGGDPLAGARGEDPNVQTTAGQQQQSNQGGIDLGSILGGLFGGR